MTTVLVIDDSPTVRKLVEIAFRPTGWKHLFAQSGAEGVAMARANTPDAILLDFVLPDMKGIDVCDKLARDEATASIPIVLMTAKGEDVRALFEPYRALAGFVPKPFTPDIVLDAIRVASSGGSRSSVSRKSVAPKAIGRAQKEAIARALFGRLRQPLASIPIWMEQLGRAPAAPFFAKKLLTPELVDDLIAAILPLVSTPQKPEAEDDVPLRGKLGGFPTRDLLTFVAGSGRTGELRLSSGDRTTVVYFRGGEIVLVTTHEPNRWLRDSGLDLSSVPRAALERAEAEQRASARPVPVSLAEAGRLPPTAGELTGLLHAQSKRLLREAAADDRASFVFVDQPALPLYVEAHGRHVSLARETLMFGPKGTSGAQSLGQLTLEKLRADAVPVALLPRPTAVFNRTRGFSDRVRQFVLTSEERTVLALVDGRTPLEDLAVRSGLDLDVMVVAHRLAAVGLITECDPRARSTNNERRPVMILEPDIEGFQRPLESLLASRAEPLPLLSLADENDVVAAVRRARPRLVILNAAATGEVVENTARAIREERELSDVSLVAVLESPMATRQGELFAAGFDAVLVKPVAYTELERLLSA